VSEANLGKGWGPGGFAFVATPTSGGFDPVAVAVAVKDHVNVNDQVNDNDNDRQDDGRRRAAGPAAVFEDTL
jgi:hypothetical protein